MKVLLIDECLNGFPNLALMKLSAWHKKQGDEVFLNRIFEKPDKIYISQPFAKKTAQNFYYNFYRGLPTEKGGYGVNSNKLPNEIEFIMPDYSLYRIDYSMGFTSRGCVRQCPFCVVPRNEGMIHEHQFVSEFLYPDHKKVILLDNNFTNSPKFKENASYLIEHKIKACITQGIDARSLNEERAKILRAMKTWNWHFTRQTLHFAWDNPKDEEFVRRGVRLLLDAGFPGSSLICYVLVNYNTSFEEDLHRCNVLWQEYKVLPFIMSFKGKHPLQHWVNRRYIKFTKWEHYDERLTK
jgi:hypothetical protein